MESPLPNSSDVQKTEVCYFQRRPRPGSNFSMEAIFEDLRKRLAGSINADIKLCSHFNDGYVSKVFNIIEARRRQSNGVNHITGEVHFLNLLMRRNRVVLTILDCGFMERKSGLGRAFVRWLYLDTPVKRSKVVTAISEETKRQVVGYTNCDPDKIKVIPVAIDDAYQPTPKEFNSDKPVILQIGTGYNKNVPRLIEALDGIACRLVVIGRLSKEQESMLQQSRIEYENLYNLSSKEMIEQYRRCDIVSFVSTFEGFGMPIVEGNAVERVVVTSNVSSMPEVASDAACLVNPLDIADIRKGIRRLMSDADYRETLIANGRINRQRFDGQRIAEQYLEVYRNVLGE